MSITPSRKLRASVKKILIPHILEHGFEKDERDIWKNDPYGHDSRRFMRWNENNLQLLNIQFDKHGTGKFVLNMGIVPPEGSDGYFGHHDQLECDVSSLSTQARLYAGNKYLMQWFGFPLMKIPFFRNPSSDKVVERVVRLFPQVDAWFNDGIEGPNIRVNKGMV